MPVLDVEKIVDGLKYDKKFTSKTNRFILLKGLNRPVFIEGVKKEIIFDSINNCIDKKLY